MAQIKEIEYTITYKYEEQKIDGLQIHFSERL